MPSQYNHWATFILPSATESAEALMLYYELHGLLFWVISVLMVLLQIKHQSPEAPPVDMQSGTMVVLLIAVLAYVITLLVEFRLRARNSDYYAIVGNLNLLSLTLALVSILKKLVPFSLWVATFALWSCCFLKGAHGSFEDFRRLLRDAALQARNFVDEVVGRENGAEEQNGPAV